MKTTLRCSLFSVICLMFCCRNNPSSSPSAGGPLPPLANAAYVLNEGNFNDPTGARLSIYDIDRDTVYTNVFELVNNGSHLGNVGDDMKIVNGKAYILMSGSANLNVIGIDNQMLLQTANFPGAAPHDLLIDAGRNRAFVTRLYKSSVLVLNLSFLSVIDSISVGNNPQGLLLNGNNLFVCNSGYGSSRTVSVVDVDSNRVKRTLILGDGPTSAAMGPNGRLWVACTGNAFGTPPSRGKVFIINASTLGVEDSIAFAENLWGTIAMGIDGYAYVLGVASGSFYGGALHRISLATRNVSLGFVSGVFYGMAVDEISGDIYLADAKEFNTNGEVLVYTKDGTFKKRFPAQRGPSTIAFKH